MLRAYAFLAGSCAAVFGYLLNGYGVPHELLVLGAFAGMPWVFYAVRGSVSKSISELRHRADEVASMAWGV